MNIYEINCLTEIAFEGGAAHASNRSRQREARGLRGGRAEAREPRAAGQDARQQGTYLLMLIYDSNRLRMIANAANHVYIVCVLVITGIPCKCRSVVL